MINPFYKPLMLFCLAAGVSAAPTTITDTIKDASGALLSGIVTITPVAAFTPSGGWHVVGTPVVVTVTSGAFSKALEPTDTATPAGQYYKAEYSFTDPGKTVRKRESELWLVPTSATALAIRQVITGTVSPTALPLTIAGGGTGRVSFTPGRCIQAAADGTRLESAVAPCGTGGGSPRTWADLLNYTWGQLLGN